MAEKKSHKVLRSCYMEVEQVNRIKELSQITRVPQAVIYRDGLDLAIEKWDKIAKKGDRNGRY